MTKNYSSYPRLRKFIQISKLENAKQRLRIQKNSQKDFAFEYMMKRAGKFVLQGDLLVYCDQRRNELTKGQKKGYRDNSRGIEGLRKDCLPLEWIEVRRPDGLWFKHCPEMRDVADEAVLSAANNRKKGFTKTIIDQALTRANRRCEITGIPLQDGGIAADHFVPRESGADSSDQNCVILNKILNEKKNNTPPVEWFCEHLLTNFLNLCKRVGLDDPRPKIIKFLQDYNY